MPRRNRMPPSGSDPVYKPCKRSDWPQRSMCLPDALSVRQRYIMNDRPLTNVTVFCSGIPVGTAPLIFRTDADGRPGVRIGPATHLPAYDGLIGRALRAYKE